MNRKILIQVAAPIVLIGLLLFGACLMGTWQISRLQAKMGQIQEHMEKSITDNVDSLRAAQKIEINLRRLRFHCILYLIRPDAAVLDKIRLDNEGIEDSLAVVKNSGNASSNGETVTAIEEAYRRYLADFDGLKEQADRNPDTFRDYRSLMEDHPVQYVIVPCEELVAANDAQMRQAEQEADNARQEAAAVSDQVRMIMYLLGFVGPLSGVIVGYGVARGLSRSIYQLSVRVHNVAQRLDQDVASIRLAADGDIAQMDSQLQHILSRVEEVAQRLQRQQRDMLRAEQLSAVGQLAASVAHEIRNPISGVKLLIEAAQRPRNPMTLTAEDLNVMHGEIARVEHTVQGLLDFARLPSPRFATADLRQTVTQAVNLVSTRARQQKVEVLFPMPPEPVLAEVDAGQLGTVLVNLLLNALDAMPRGGRLEVTIDGSGADIQVAVSDTGAGIAPDMVDKLFVPFASTKPTGTGLGLSICRRIVEEHAGRIAAENLPAGGARFTVTLPNRSAASLGERGVRARQGSAPNGACE